MNTPFPGSSEYMHWAKTRQAARYNLAVSAVPPVSTVELGIAPEDLEIQGPSGYGWPPLVEALAATLKVDPDRVFPTEGASMANYLALAVCLQPGDELLLEHPSYELLADAARHLGAVVRRFPRRREDGYAVDVARVRERLTPRTRVIAVTHLHNPSSAAVSEPVLQELTDLAGSHGARLLVDEVYAHALFEASRTTTHRLDETIVATNSLTKVYGLAGLRCGWIVADPEFIRRAGRLNDLFGVNPPHLVDRLRLRAVRQLPRLAARAREVLQRNLQPWNAWLDQQPRLEGGRLAAGTVAFPRLREGSVDELARQLRDEFDTTIVPGHFFGEPGSFRVGLGVIPADFDEGLRRLGTLLARG